MKQILIALLILTIGCESENKPDSKFNLSELLAMRQMSQDSFDTYVTKRGYIFQQVLNSGIIYTQKGDTLKSNHRAVHYDTVISGKSTETIIAYLTNDENEYLKMKDDLKKAGFHLSKTQNVKNMAAVRYIKGEVGIDIVQTKSNSGETMYAATIAAMKVRKPM